MIFGGCRKEGRRKGECSFCKHRLYGCEMYCRYINKIWDAKTRSYRPLKKGEDLVNLLNMMRDATYNIKGSTSFADLPPRTINRIEEAHFRWLNRRDENGKS